MGCWTFRLAIDKEKEGELPAAILLFLEQRARRIEPQFQISTKKEYQEALHLCEILDGLPLGIELAANLLKNYTSAEIAELILQDINILFFHIARCPLASPQPLGGIWTFLELLETGRNAGSCFLGSFSWSI